MRYIKTFCAILSLLIGCAHISYSQNNEALMNEKHQIFVYEHSAMSKVHKTHISNEHQAGRINLVSNNGVIVRQITEKQFEHSSAAKSVADNLITSWVGNSK